MRELFLNNFSCLILLDNLYISDDNNFRILKVSGGTITTIAGVGSQGYSGDNGPAISAQLNYPQGIFVDSSGIYYTKIMLC